MISCLAIDDEPLALRQLTSYIQKVPFLSLRQSCHSALEAAEILRSEVVDAIFVDINMPDLNGMDLVKSLAVPPLIVFTTAYSEYAIESYKANAVDYLLKPFGFDDFLRAAAKVKEQSDMRAAISSAKEPDGNDALFFKTDFKIIRVSVKSIVYVEGMSEYLKIHTDDSAEPVVVFLSIKRLEERLPSEMFMRIHKSYLINLNSIREVTKNHVLLQNGKSLPIGDLYKDTFKNYLDKKFLGR
ncbi:MAG: LytTR family DNA-binding domain-containing protein [Bacteroidales bacterium]